jgi:hypothetical protein
MKNQAGSQVRNARHEKRVDGGDVISLPVIEDGGELDESLLLSPVLIEEAISIWDKHVGRWAFVAISFVSGALLGLALTGISLMHAALQTSLSAVLCATALACALVGAVVGARWETRRR